MEISSVVADIIDRELRLRGSSLITWLMNHGLTPCSANSLIEDVTKGCPVRLFDLSQELGVSTPSLISLIQASISG